MPMIECRMICLNGDTANRRIPSELVRSDIFQQSLRIALRDSSSESAMTFAQGRLMVLFFSAPTLPANAGQRSNRMNC